MHTDAHIRQRDICNPMNLGDRSTTQYPALGTLEIRGHLNYFIQLESYKHNHKTILAKSQISNDRDQKEQQLLTRKI